MKNLKEMLQQAKEGKSNFNKGEIKLLINYRNTADYTDSSILVVSEIVWEDEIETFFKSLEENNISEFIINERSTGLMNLIQAVLANGFQIKGLADYNYKNSFSTKKETGLLVSKA